MSGLRLAMFLSWAVAALVIVWMATLPGQRLSKRDAAVLTLTISVWLANLLKAS